MPLVGTGVRCEDNAGHDAHMDMAGMSMPDMAGMPMPSGNEDGSDNSHSDCSFPWSPADCQSMASCTPTAMSVEAPSVAAFVATAYDEPTARVPSLRSVTRAPEPPPPRA